MEHRYWQVLEGKFVGNSGWQDLGHYKSDEFGDLGTIEKDRLKKDLEDFKKGNERQEFRIVFWKEEINGNSLLG